MEGLRVGPDQRPDGVVALGNPGAFIEQAGHGEEWLEVDLGNGCAETGKGFEIAFIGLTGLAVAEELPLRLERNTDREMRRDRHDIGRRQLARQEIRRVVALRRCRRLGRVCRFRGEDGDGVERAAGRYHAGGRQQAEARLQPGNAIERGRHPAGTCRIGAERECDDACPHGHGGAGGRTTGHERRVQRIARHAVG